MPASGPHDAAALDGAALTNAAERLLTRGTAIGDIDRVRRAVALSESVLATTRPGSANHTAASANAARALIAEYEMTGRAGALDRAVRLLDSTDPDSGLLGDRGADFFPSLVTRCCGILNAPAFPIRPSGLWPHGARRAS